MDEVFKIKSEVFEGPLELLLDLIEKRKLSINQISLAKVADDFLNYIKSFESFPIAESADFILVASTLLLIKSKSLLPNLELSPEEEGSIEDLQKRLVLYQSIKEQSKKIKEIFGLNPMFFPNDRKIEPVFAPHEGINLKRITEAVGAIISAIPKFEKTQKAFVQKIISLEQMITNLSDRIQKSLRMSFREFAGVGKKEKVHIIVSFLALLELVKRGSIKVAQENHLGDITIETEADLATPKYI